MRIMTSKWIQKSILGATAIAAILASGAVSANAVPQEFRGRVESARGVERRIDHGFDRGFDRRFDRGYVREGFRPGVVVNSYATDYIPPCPGDGYVWTAGYYDGGVWIPGVWTFRGHVGFDRVYAYGRVEQRGFEHREFEARRFENQRAGVGPERRFEGRR